MPKPKRKPLNTKEKEQPAPAPVRAIPTKRKQMIVELWPGQWRQLRDVSLDEGTSVREIVLRGCAMYLEAKGITMEPDPPKEAGIET